MSAPRAAGAPGPRAEGLSVDSQTRRDVINRLAMIAKDVPEAIFAHVLAAAVVGADETRWRLLDGRGRDAGEACCLY